MPWAFSSAEFGELGDGVGRWRRGGRRRRSGRRLGGDGSSDLGVDLGLLLLLLVSLGVGSLLGLALLAAAHTPGDGGGRAGDDCGARHRADQAWSTDSTDTSAHHDDLLLCVRG